MLLPPPLSLPPTANLVLSGSYERVHHPPSFTFADIPRGVFLVRGENVVLMGEIVRPTHTSPTFALSPPLPPTPCSSPFSPSCLFVRVIQDLDVEDTPPIPLIPAPIPQVLGLAKKDQELKARQDERKTAVLHERGFDTENQEGDAY